VLVPTGWTDGLRRGNKLIIVYFDVFRGIKTHARSESDDTHRHLSKTRVKLLVPLLLSSLHHWQIIYGMFSIARFWSCSRVSPLHLAFLLLLPLKLSSIPPYLLYRPPSLVSSRTTCTYTHGYLRWIYQESANVLSCLHPFLYQRYFSDGKYSTKIRAARGCAGRQ
jgi:hypothetical protein